MGNRTWTNDARTVLIQLWEDPDDDVSVSTLTVAIRPSPSDVWGPPVVLKEEVWTMAPVILEAEDDDE